VGIQHLCDALTVNRTLTCLNLGENRVGVRGVEALIALLESLQEVEGGLNELYLDWHETSAPMKGESYTTMVYIIFSVAKYVH
jgi:hypothetical protein